MRQSFGFHGDGFHRQHDHPHRRPHPGHDFDPHARARHGGPFGGFGPGGFGPGFGPGGFGPPQGFPPGFGGPWQGRGRGGGRGRGRQRRGDVRAAVLALLTERPMHGYEMIREITERSGNAWRPSPGSVYPLLQQLADEDLITESGEGRGGKKLFALTEEGKQEAEQHTENPPWEQAAAEAPAEDSPLQAAAAQLAGAAVQLFMVGSADQRNRAVTILNNARKELYGILAEDAPADDGEQDED